MPVYSEDLPPLLQQLLLQCTQAGLPVGISERLIVQQWLTEMTAQKPAIEAGDVIAFLRPLLCKQPEQQGLFDEIASAWLEQAENWWKQHRADALRPKNKNAEPASTHTATDSQSLSQHTAAKPQKKPNTKPPSPRLWLASLRKALATLITPPYALYLATFCLVFGLTLWNVWTPKTHQKCAENDPHCSSSNLYEVNSTSFPTIYNTVPLQEKQYTASILTIPVNIKPPFPTAWAFFATFAALSLGFVYVYRRNITRLFIPAREKPVAKVVEPLPVFQSESEFKPPSPTDRNRMVWGIQQYRSAYQNNNLDIVATVKSTAEQYGVIEPRFLSQKYDFEVWLWRDVSTQTPFSFLLYNKIQAYLSSAGLKVHCALYYICPDELYDEQGQVLDLAILEEQQNHAIVLLFSDGEALSDGLANSSSQRALLRRLSYWSKMTLVDFGQTENLLQQTLADHHLSRLNVILPREIPAFLSGSSDNPRLDLRPELQGENLFWAAAAAFYPDKIQEQQLYDLSAQKDLAIRPNPWVLQSLYKSAESSSGFLQWPEAKRRKWLNWLSDLSAVTGHGMGRDSSPLTKVQAYWVKQLRTELAQLQPQKETPAITTEEAKREILLAVLELWRDPEDSAKRLQAWEQHYAPWIQQHLRKLSLWGEGDDQHVQLPWARSALSDECVLRLQRLGLAMGEQTYQAHLPGRYYLAFGTLAGMVLSAGLWLGYWAVFAELPAAQKPILPHPALESDIGHEYSASPLFPKHELALNQVDGQWQVTLTYGEQRVQEAVDVGQRLRVDWRVLEPELQPQEIDVAEAKSCTFGELHTDKKTGMEFSSICPGEFIMGDNDSKYDDERPEHKVTIDYAFLMGRTEVTFAQYDAYAEATGVKKPDDRDWGRNQRPVIHVSWHDAQGYVSWLSEQTGLSCRLPSEAEWEYAARAGTTTDYFWGDEEPSCDKNARNGASFNGGEKSNCYYQVNGNWRGTETVGSYTANPWGLYDVHGNVWEWAEDCWQSNYENAPTDGSAWEVEKGQTCGSGNRVLRGGSWLSYPSALRSAVRRDYFPAYVINYVGFRVVCSHPFSEH